MNKRIISVICSLTILVGFVGFTHTNAYASETNNTVKSNVMSPMTQYNWAQTMLVPGLTKMQVPGPFNGMFRIANGGYPIEQAPNLPMTVKINGGNFKVIVTSQSTGDSYAANLHGAGSTATFAKLSSIDNEYVYLQNLDTTTTKVTCTVVTPKMPL